MVNRDRRRAPRVFNEPFVAAISLAAFLVACTAPLFGALMLPVSSDASLMWSTAILCFLSLLLAGYGYAAWLQRRLMPRRQAVVHIALCAAAFLSFPIHVDPRVAEAHAGAPVYQTAALLLRGVGVPFFALAASIPLLQGWFHLLRGNGTRRLRALRIGRNAGAVAGLLAYPLILEPLRAVHRQAAFWTLGFVVLFVCLVMVAAALFVRPFKKLSLRLITVPDAPMVSVLVRCHWVATAMIPWSVMLAVTAVLARSIAPMPVVWIMPLALYLATFSFASAGRSVFGAMPARKAPQWLFIVTALASAAYLRSGELDILPLPMQVCLLLLLVLLIAVRAQAATRHGYLMPDQLAQLHVYSIIGAMLGALLDVVLLVRWPRDASGLAFMMVLAACVFSARTQDSKIA